MKWRQRQRDYASDLEDNGTSYTQELWTESCKGEFATCDQTSMGSEEFFFGHMFAVTEDDIIKQLYVWGFSQYVNSMITEIHANISAYADPNDVIKLPPL
jgi:hypothetical protein